MQPAKGPSKRIASALVLATMVAVTASTAIGRSRLTDAQPPGPTQSACTARHCMLHSVTGGSTISVVPTRVPAGKTPSFAAPTSNPAEGMLHGQRRTGVLDCGSYQPADNSAYQFYLGGTFRGNVLYKVTYTVNTSRAPAQIEFCLGATFHFKTRSGQPAKSVTLPNGLTGFAGLVPSCKMVPNGPCLVSKAQAAKGRVMLKLLIRAVADTDPWGRS